MKTQVELIEAIEELLDDKYIADFWLDDKDPEYFIKSLDGRKFSQVCQNIGYQRGFLEAKIETYKEFIENNIEMPISFLEDIIEKLNNYINDYYVNQVI